jgi:tetratricopeptide (TPR) repeat protein
LHEIEPPKKREIHDRPSEANQTIKRSGIIAMLFLAITLSATTVSAQSDRQGLAIFNKAQELMERAKSKDELYMAQELFERALSIFDRAKFARGSAGACNELGIINERLGHYDKALEYYAKSLKITQKTGDLEHQSATLNNIAAIYMSLGDYGKALEYFERSFEISRRIGDAEGEAISLNNIGLVLKTAGQYQHALEHYERSAEISKKLGNQKNNSVALSNMGGIHHAWGNYRKAIERYEQSASIMHQIGDLQGEAISVQNMAGVYSSCGDYQQALACCEKSLTMARRIGDSNTEAAITCNIGTVLKNLKRLEEAQSYLLKAMALEARLGIPTDQTSDLIGNMHLDNGNIAEAEPFLKKSGYDSSLGRMCLLKSDYSLALKYYQKLLKRAEENRDANNLFTAYTGLARVYEAQEDYGKAEGYYEKGVQFTEEIRSGLLPSERKDFFTVKVNGFSRSDPGKGLTRVRMKLNQASGSIDSSEVTRARAFADNLFERSATSGSSLPQKVLDKEDDLLNRLAALKKELGKTDRERQAERYETLSKEVKNAESDLKTFIEKLRKDSPGYAAVKYPRPVTLGESALHPDEYVVMFDVSNEGVGVKLIHGKKIAETHYKDWPLSDLENDVKHFREPFETKKLKDFDPELGHALYRKLMARVMMDVPKGKPIVIIPDGILAVLPFEALVTGGTATWTKGTVGEYPEGITYLGDDHPISYYQSITALTLARTMGNKTRPGDKLLVVADPVFQMRDDRAQSVRQERVVGKEGEFYVNVMKAIEDDSGVRFANLPETGVMADKLGEMFKPNSLVLTGLKANKADFLKDIAPKLDQYGRIVFATHGVFSTRIPGLKEPFLALTMVPPGTDGFLRMSDILSLKMNADIVALTACQTGLGKELSGEGVMSMGRAFQYAGANAVLMSLWEVQVDSALRLVETFFQNLKAGRSKLDALTAARDQVKKEGYLHPFYWAPFILVGEVK